MMDQKNTPISFGFILVLAKCWPQVKSFDDFDERGNSLRKKVNDRDAFNIKMCCSNGQTLK